MNIDLCPQRLPLSYICSVHVWKERQVACVQPPSNITVSIQDNYFMVRNLHKKKREENLISDGWNFPQQIVKAQTNARTFEIT
jgi:hypothetical protein